MRQEVETNRKYGQKRIGGKHAGVEGMMSRVNIEKEKNMKLQSHASERKSTIKIISGVSLQKELCCSSHSRTMDMV